MQPEEAQAFPDLLIIFYYVQVETYHDGFNFIFFICGSALPYNEISLVSTLQLTIFPN